MNNTETFATIVKRHTKRPDFIKEFHWGTMNFDTQTIHLTKHMAYVKLYCDIVDIMDDFDMMSYTMPFYMATIDQVSFNEKWKIEGPFKNPFAL